MDEKNNFFKDKKAENKTKVQKEKEKKERERLKKRLGLILKTEMKSFGK
jgi:hypothetical protein